MTRVDPAIDAHFLRLRNKYVARDARMFRMKLVREGNIDVIFPDEFSDDWPKSITANFIDVAIRDLSESIAGIPTLQCATGKETNDAREYSAKKVKAGMGSWKNSRLKTQIVQAVDRYASYGFMPIVVEPDFDRGFPTLRFEDPWQSYPEFDRWGHCIRFAKMREMKAMDLAALFPEYSNILGRDFNGLPNYGHHRLVTWMDKDQTLIYVPTLDNLILTQMSNPLSRCPVAIAVRPGIDDETRSQFDDVIWTQIARNKLAMLALQATEDSVNAPIAVPDDMQELAIGPKSIMRSKDPMQIHKVDLNLPPGIFNESQVLQQEMILGGRYSQSHGGNVQASVITGRGIEALQSGYDNQIQTAQNQIGEALAEATSMAFEMDCKVFGGVQRVINGNADGQAYQINWEPERDLRDDYSCEVTYGFAAGQSTAQAIVTMLQLRADQDLSSTTMMKNLPFDVDIESERRLMDVEQGEKALKDSIFSLGNAIPAMVEQGQDPSSLIGKIAQFVLGRQAGKAISDLAVILFPAPTPEQIAAAQQQAQAQQAAASGGAPGGPPSPGGPLAPADPNAPPPQGPGSAAPDMMQMIAGLRGDGSSPNMQAKVSRSTYA